MARIYGNEFMATSLWQRVTGERRTTASVRQASGTRPGGDDARLAWHAFQVVRWVRDSCTRARVGGRDRDAGGGLDGGERRQRGQLRPCARVPVLDRRARHPDRVLRRRR